MGVEQRGERRSIMGVLCCWSWRIGVGCGMVVAFVDVVVFGDVVADGGGDVSECRGS